MSRARGTLAAVLTVLVLLVVAACSSGDYEATPLPTVTPTTSAQGSGGTTATTTPAACTNATQSYDPFASLTGADATAAVAKIKQRGYLVAGVSADTLLLGSRNPLTGQIEGFDIDVVHEIATAIFGDASKVQLVVITAGDRIPKLQNNSLDVVVRNMTMTCARWGQIGFSVEYYRSGLKILVPKGSTVTSLAGLSGKKVCAPDGTSTMDVVKATAGVIPVGAVNHTGCLVLFQQGQVDAIAGDDTVLAGLVAQDPYASVPKMDPLTAEPYGVGVNKANAALARYINTLLIQAKDDGRWKAMYDKWFASALGPAPAPPQSVTGRA